MNLKKSLIIMLSVLCIFLMIASVNAADSSNDAVNATNNDVATVNAINEDTLGTENDGEILGDGEVGTFTDLKNNISIATSGALELNNNFELSTSTDSAIVSYIGIDIQKTLTIDGKGHYIDAKGQTNVFNIYSKVTFKNIIFKNGKSAYGGFLYYYTSSNCEIINCTFINGLSTSYGGVVRSDGTSINVINSTFINNSATGKGGALYINAYNFGNIENCTFINNSANDEGSAIYGYSDGTIRNSIFINNEGNTVIYSNSGTTASYNWFGNTIEDYETNVPSVGSGVTVSNYYVLDMSLDNNNCEATVYLNNLYENEVLTQSYEGYALPSIRFDIKATGTTAVESIVLGSSGVKTFNYASADAYSITISNSTVELTREVKPSFILLNNKIAADGVSEITLDQDYEWDSSKDSSLTNGIVFAKDMTIDGQGHIIDAKGLSNIFYFNDYADSYNLLLKNLVFKNAVGENGAVIYFKGNKIEIINCTFLNNTANQGDAIHIVANSNENKITQSLFINNTCSNSIIYIDSDNACTIDNSILVNNSASNTIVGSSNVIADNNWWGNTQENNATDISDVNGVTVNNWLFLKIDASAVITGTATVSLNNIYDGNSIGKYTGYALPKISINVAGNGAKLSKEFVALDNGEGTFNFMMTNTESTLTASFKNINTNKQLEYVIVDDGSFKNLNDLIHFTPENGILNLNRDFAFVEGADDDYADGISVLKGLTINGNNHAVDAKKKSAIFWLQGGDVFINNITFKNAIGDGVLYNQADSLTVKYCDFINNTASSGGAIYDNAGSTFVNCTFLNNTATNGAVLYSYQGSTTFINSTFGNNSASKGGTMYIYDGNIKCENCSFGNNSATTAGVIYAYYGTVECINSTFENNSATNAGVFYNYYARFSLNDCDIKNNTANQGAVLYDSGYYSSFLNSRIIKNKALSGSIIHGRSNNAIADKCIFINNTATASVIYSTSSYTLKNSILLNNSVNSIIDAYYTQQITADNNWFGNTYDNYADSPMSGDILDNWLFLNIRFHNDYAIVCLDQYVKSSDSVNTYTENNLPTFTLNINSTSLDLSGINNVTLNSNGASDVSYSLINEPGALTASFEQVSLTKELIFGDFDIIQDLINDETSDLIELDRDYTYNTEDTITTGILIDRNITIDGKGHTIDAKGKSRIFNLQASGITFKNIIFANGKTTYGPAIFYNCANTDEIDFEIVNCTFVNNTATASSSSYGGGAIFIKTNAGSFEIKDSSFINNSAYLSSSYSSFGGAIYLNTKNAEVNIYNTSFINNKGKNGGAIYVASDSSLTTIDKCIFKENQATESTGSSYGNAILWKTTNDNGKNVVKNSIFIENYNNNNFAFSFSSGSVTIDDNWWGSTTNNGKRLDSNIISGITPTSWLFLNASVSSSRLLYNETSTISYYLQSFDGTQVSEFDNTLLPIVTFDVNSDNGGLNKDIVSLNEEFTYTPINPGSACIDIYCNNLPYETWIKGPYMVPIVDIPFTIYANQGLDKNAFIITAKKTSSGYSYAGITVSCNDTELINLNGNYDVTARTTEGTVKLIFTYEGSANYDPETFEMDVNVVRVPLTINVTNIESNEITLNVSDEMDLDISFEIDSIHKGYAPAWNVGGFEYDNSVITFNYDSGDRPDNGSSYPTGHIKAKAGGTTNLTIYCTSDKFKWENYTIKITVNKIPTEITIDDVNPLKVDDESSINANFYINGTLNTTTNLIYESSDENVIKFISGSDFKAVGNGTAIITVKFNGNSTHENSSATITVMVTKYETTTSITSDKDISLKIDEQSQIITTLISQDTSFSGSLIYISSNESVATVDSNGLITAVGEGSTIITAKYDGNYRYSNSSDSLMVTVSKIDSSITLNTENPLEINVFNEAQIDALLNHEGDLLYVSSNPDVITVNQTTGKITAKAGGRANITISYGGNDKYAKADDVNLTVIVSKLPSHITVENAISVDVDANNNISATVDNGRSLHYVSANPSIVTVDENTGVITGVIGGTANVTVIFDEDDQYLSDGVNVTVTVNKLQSTFTIENPAITVDVYGNALIQASSNNDGEMTFASCDASIATVDGNAVTALKGGKVNVTLSVPETDRCLANETNVTVTVNKLQSTINVANEISVYVDESKTIGASVNDNRPLRYVSADSGIVVVNANGVITGVIGGCANVTVIFDEDDQYLGSEVNVTVTVNKLEAIIDVEPISVDVYQNKSLNAQIISDGDISYVSTNPGIASVNETGYVTGVIGGKANITIAVGETNRYLAKSVNVTVTVNKLPSIFTNGPMSLSVDENATINSTLNHNGSVHYEFDSTKLNVTEDGLVIALAGGVHTINVIFDGNEIYLENSSTVTVTVSRLPADYENEPINLTVFETSNIEFLIIGYDHTNSEYSSSNETVFTVDNNGLITALAGGSALLNIKFPETDRYLGNSINITVNVKKLPSIFTGDNQISVKVDETKSLPVSVGHNRQLIYESSNPNIVTVDNGGLIRGIIGGTAFITVRYEEDGQYLANSTKISVTVNKLPSNIVVETQTITMYIDDNATVIATTDNDGGLFFTTNSSIISLAGDGKVTGLSEGTANVIIAVFETDTHLSNRTTLKVTVKKIPTAINVEELQLAIDVNDNQLINARLNHTGASGLTYTSSNPEVVAVDGDGRITALIGGQANITISYAGDDKFVAAEDVIVNVISNKLPTVIEVNDTFSLKVDDTVPIGASINHNGSQLKYTISNSSVITIDEATGEITAIGAGLVNITISCEETDKYLKAEDVTVSVEVTKFETIINVDNENPVEISVFDESVIIASLNYPQAGELTYASSDENVVTVDDEGIITAIGGGNANITISYDGNGKYAAAEKITINVVVNKLSSQIFVDDAISIDVYSFKSLNAYMETGRPLRYISNNESIAIVDEYGVVKGIVGGKTIITVIFEGDSEYEGCEVNVTVTVNKLSSKIDVESQQLVVEVGSNVEIIATTNSDADLRYLSLNSTIASVNGIVVTGVVGGTVNVTVSVPECDKYLADEVNVTITVIKHQSVINIESATLTVDVDGTVNIIATTNSDANLTYVSLNSSVASVDGNVVTGVIGGTVNITVSVPESDRYLASEANVTVVVNKLQSVINIESYSLVVDVDGSVNIIASTNSDGNLDYESLDTSIATVDANVVRGVIGGTVKVRVSVDETERYLANEANVTVVVNKLQSVINIESYSLVVDVDGSVLINASSDSDAGLTYASLDSSIAAVEGNAVTGISSGIVNVTVSVGETGRYLAKDVNVTVTVNKAKSVISANNITVYVDGTKSIDATLNVAGSLRYINRNPEIVSIDESGMVKGIIGGTANITIIFDETNKYLGSEINVTVTVNKLQPVIDLESDSLAVEVEGNVLINASTDSDAELIYESLDESVATVNLNNVTALIGGKVIVRVSVPESDRYLAKSVNITVAVKKHDSIIIIENDEISVEVDGKQQIVASTNSDSPIIFFTMSPIVSIGGTGVVTGISNGTAEVLLNVAESDKYSSNTSVVVVKVNKIPTAIMVNESISVTVDDEINLNATLDHEGQLSFTSLNESIASVDAKGNIKAVKVGKTQIIVSFEENDKYFGNSITVDVTVNKMDIPINDTISMDLQDASRTPTFSIDLPNATGNFSVIVDGKEIGPVSLKDGKANITVPELAYGSHNVTVVYSGDDKYGSIAQNTTVNITKPVLSENKDIAMLYSANAVYKVHVTVEGKAVVGQNVTFKFNGKTYNVKTDKNGYAAFKLPAVKPKKAKYAITATFHNVKVKNKVKVNSIIKAKNLKIKKSKRVVKIKVSLKKVNGKYLKGKQLKLKIKGKTLKAKTNKKGVATFKLKKNVLKKLKVGKKYKYRVSYGKDVVTKKLKVKR